MCMPQNKECICLQTQFSHLSTLWSPAPSSCDPLLMLSPAKIWHGSFWSPLTTATARFLSDVTRYLKLAWNKISVWQQFICRWWWRVSGLSLASTTDRTHCLPFSVEDSLELWGHRCWTCQTPKKDRLDGMNSIIGSITWGGAFEGLSLLCWRFFLYFQSQAEDMDLLICHAT